MPWNIFRSMRWDRNPILEEFLNPLVALDIHSIIQGCSDWFVLVEELGNVLDQVIEFVLERIQELRGFRRGLLFSAKFMSWQRSYKYLCMQSNFGSGFK